MSVDLRTEYLGLTLSNPLVVAACPLTAEVQMLQRLEEAGAAAAVTGSLFAEQIEFDRAEYCGTAWFGAVAQSPPHWAYALSEYNSGPDGYLRHIAAAKRAVRMPIIGSLNATACGDWIVFSRLIEEAGADALELNVYLVPSDAEISGDEIEDRYVELVAAVRSQISIPLAVKIGPYFSSLPHMARRLVEAGADGLVLFNRFLQPDIDLCTLEVAPRLVLSSSDELRLPLRWIGILHNQLPASLAASTGLHTADDVMKLVLAGADVTMLASALIQRGPAYLTTVLHELAQGLQHRGFMSLDHVRGLASKERCSNPAAYERANYAKALATISGSPTNATGGPHASALNGQGRWQPAYT
jgi:dihydroorotate dehydrogenase (fumarate)